MSTISSGVDALRTVLLELRYMTEYGRVGTRDADQARFRKVIDAALALLEQQDDGWLPIESAPKDGTRVLLAIVGVVVVEGFWTDGYDDGPDTMGHDACWLDMGATEFSPPRSFGVEAYRTKGVQPTHWRPLPPPPGAAPTHDETAAMEREALGDPDKRTGIYAPREAQPCRCETCEPQDINKPGSIRMVLCAICGNKRCPHATDHRLACTGSNDAGQDGSSYGPTRAVFVSRKALK